MTPSDDMSQKILRFIHVTGGSDWKVMGILALAPRKATLNFGRFSNDENQIYLWHGTSAVNLLSILKDGLLVDPGHAAITSRLFGDVALGKCYRLDSSNSDWVNATPKGYDSLHVLGRKHPGSSITVDG
ncbi:unnamed protein product [Angiostrongylus costaricensis]|uniref:Poly [ADP-ribose] polymerase n=1 Tax=Angiostrongylus costaricensis TaxID=334426 RepID=A0A0R3PTE7_ANGCS|nr:unnamed protein product [Angiostrongylus costaricensis]